LKKSFDTLPHFSEKMQLASATIGGGDTFLNLPSPHHHTPPFVENAVDPSNSTNTKHKKKSQTEKV
jgi:hypothetical protein